MNEEEQAIGAESAPFDLEDEQPVERPLRAPIPSTLPKKPAEVWTPVRDQRIASLLSIGRYRPAPARGRPVTQSHTPTYSQIGKWPTPRPSPGRRPADKPVKKT